MIDFNGKSYLVTGASSGIGRAIAIEISKLDAEIYIVGRKIEELEKTKSHCKNPNKVKSIVIDLTDENAPTKIIEQINDKIDGVVLSAGKMGLIPYKFINHKSLKSYFDINFFSPALTIVELLKKNKIKDGGSVVSITSINGSAVTSKANSIYSASKAALDVFTKSLCLELGKNNIRFNNIAPGMVVSDGYESVHNMVGADAIAEDIKKYPIGRYGNPNEIAQSCVYLLSNMSSWVNGTTLVIDGGYCTQ